jgi:F1F0 ATPase subunit 2
MVIEAFSWFATIGAGMVLGFIFFGGLWWTVKKGVSSPRPALWFFLSLQARMIIAIGGIFLVSHGRWDLMMVCLVGFIVARFSVAALTQRWDPSRGEAGP